MPEAKIIAQTYVCVSVRLSELGSITQHFINDTLPAQYANSHKFASPIHTILSPPYRLTLELEPSLKTHFPTVSVYINYKDSSRLIYIRDRSGPAGVSIMNWPLHPVFSPYLIVLPLSLAAVYDFTQVLKPLIASVVLFRILKD